MKNKRYSGLTEDGAAEARHHDRLFLMSQFAIAMSMGNYPSNENEANAHMNRATLLADAYLRKRDELDKEVFDDE